MNPCLLKNQKEQQELVLLLQKTAERLAFLKEQEQRILTGTVCIDENEPVSVYFGKNAVAWNGGVLGISGDGYKILKALYYANGKYLTREDLEELVWDKKKLKEANEERLVKQDTFLQAVSRLAEKLESADFPYRVAKVESEAKYEPTGKKFKSGMKKIKPLKPEIIGVRLIPTVDCKNVGLEK